MLFWIFICAMLGIAILFFLVPLARTGLVTDDTYFGHYKQRLEELDGLLTANPKDESLREERVLTARHLLRESGDRNGVSSGSSRHYRTALSALAMFAIPAIALGLYLWLGEAGRPNVPLSAQLEETGEGASMQSMLAKVERHLQQNPDDAEGWTILARVYGASGEHRKRHDAVAQLIRLQGRKPDLLADLAEAKIQIDGNLVPASARQLLDEALQFDPESQKAAYYRTIAMEQSGEVKQALAAWTALRNMHTDDSDWQTLVNQRIARLQEIGNRTSEQNAMIEGMVAGLRARLMDDPSDLDGWKRLMRSYSVLDRQAEAQSALAEALASDDLQPNVRQHLVGLQKTFGKASQ